MFYFKQFSVDQTGCAMKINTDGVLLGALVNANDPKTILDIGTGTGVIALMLAQRFQKAQIDAVEIDQEAAKTAIRNFENSPFQGRMTVYPVDFAEFFDMHSDRNYDVIVSNPPFYINSLKSPQKSKEVAKHADRAFFENLVRSASAHLAAKGILCLILPMDTAELVLNIAGLNGLFLMERINICSYSHSEMHRQLLYLSSQKTDCKERSFIIYNEPGVHTAGYQAALKDFFTIF